MKTKILKKINERIRIMPKNDSFVVEHRPLGSYEWHELNSFSTITAAINKKNSYIVMVIMRDLGFRNEFVKRRIKRNNK
jgi:hypothetical protein